jgi:hypothetical protein
LIAYCLGPATISDTFLSENLMGQGKSAINSVESLKSAGLGARPKFVIPAQAGIHGRAPQHDTCAKRMRVDSRLRGNDEEKEAEAALF